MGSDGKLQRVLVKGRLRDHLARTVPFNCPPNHCIAALHLDERDLLPATSSGANLYSPSSEANIGTGSDNIISITDQLRCILSLSIDKTGLHLCLMIFMVY